MEELFKDNYPLIIICLSVISILLFVVVLIDQLYNKKIMLEENKKLKAEIDNLRNQLNGNANGKNQKTYQSLSASSQTLQMQQQGYSYQHQQRSTHLGINQTSTMASYSTNGSPVSEKKTLVDNPESKKTQESNVYQYLQEAINGKFLKTQQNPEKCYFRTWEEDGGRKYEFFGNVDKALANINAIFDDVCEIEGKRSGATDIENISAGTLDSELRITSKAKIRLK